MLDAYPPDLQDFVLQKIASGEFKTADEFAVKAAQMYRDLDLHHQELKKSVEGAIADLDAGNCIKFKDENELRAYGEEIKRRGRERLQNSALKQ
jgi:hypothetical protein